MLDKQSSSSTYINHKPSTETTLGYIYPDAPCMEYLPTFGQCLGKCRQIFHTWSIWDINIHIILVRTNISDALVRIIHVLLYYYTILLIYY